MLYHDRDAWLDSMMWRQAAALRCIHQRPLGHRTSCANVNVVMGGERGMSFIMRHCLTDPPPPEFHRWMCLLCSHMIQRESRRWSKWGKGELLSEASPPVCSDDAVVWCRRLPPNLNLIHSSLNYAQGCRRSWGWGISRAYWCDRAGRTIATHTIRLHIELVVCSRLHVCDQ